MREESSLSNGSWRANRRRLGNSGIRTSEVTIAYCAVVVSQTMGEEVEGFAVATLPSVENDVFGDKFILERLYSGKDCGNGIGDIARCGCRGIVGEASATKKLEKSYSRLPPGFFRSVLRYEV